MTTLAQSSHSAPRISRRAVVHPQWPRDRSAPSASPTIAVLYTEFTRAAGTSPARLSAMLAPLLAILCGLLLAADVLAGVKGMNRVVRGLRPFATVIGVVAIVVGILSLLSALGIILVLSGLILATSALASIPKAGAALSRAGRSLAAARVVIGVLALAVGIA